MRIAIIGPGAMGGLFAYLLSKNKEVEIFLLDIHPERVEKMRTEGLFIEGVSGDHQLWPKITLEASDIGQADIVLLCTKSSSTYQAALMAKPLLGPDTPVLTLQNGWGNIEAVEQALGADRPLGGTTSMGATALAPNRIRHAGWGDTVIGEPGGKKTARADKVLDLFRSCDLDISFTENLTGLIWSKLIINVGINALTALTHLHNGKLINYDGSRAIMEKAVAEAVQVASALKVQLLYDDALTKVTGVCNATAGNISSMLQDILKEKKTEIGQINGAIVREGEKCGIPTPVNEVLLHLVKTVEESYSERIKL